MRLSDYDTMCSIEIAQMKLPKGWVSDLPYKDIRKRCICPFNSLLTTL